MPLITECERTKECRHAKSEYDSCVARVTRAQEDENHKGHKEDCVEECKYHVNHLRGLDHIADDIALSVFHITHCAMDCAAPKLFRMLA